MHVYHQKKEKVVYEIKQNKAKINSLSGHYSSVLFIMTHNSNTSRSNNKIEIPSFLFHFIFIHIHTIGPLNTTHQANSTIYVFGKDTFSSTCSRFFFLCIDIQYILVLTRRKKNFSQYDGEILLCDVTNGTETKVPYRRKVMI